jgi:hypothetical protein
VFLVAVAAFVGIASLEAQGWEFGVGVGYNIGGSMPMPLPQEIRAIETYSPDAFAPHIAGEALRWLNDKWGVAVQIAYDVKGFEVRDRVKSLYTEIEMDDGSVQNGNFTGKNTTQVRNIYLSTPVMAVFNTSKRWSSRAGIYVAWLASPTFRGSASDGYLRNGSPIGEKIEVPNATFDFSSHQNRIDYGLQMGEQWNLGGKIYVFGQLNWGLRPLFPDDFNAMSFRMRNVYGTVGLSYMIF